MHFTISSTLYNDLKVLLGTFAKAKDQYNDIVAMASDSLCPPWLDQQLCHYGQTHPFDSHKGCRSVAGT